MNFEPKKAPKTSDISCKRSKSVFKVLDHSTDKLQWTMLKGHSRVAHMRIRYHFISNLHITGRDTIHTVFKQIWLKQYYRMSKSALKNRFFSKRLTIKQNTTKIEADGTVDVLWFQVCYELFKVRKLVSRSARSQSWPCPCLMVNETSHLHVKLVLIPCMNTLLSMPSLNLHCNVYMHTLFKLSLTCQDRSRDSFFQISFTLVVDNFSWRIVNRV